MRSKQILITLLTITLLVTGCSGLVGTGTTSEPTPVYTELGIENPATANAENKPIDVEELWKAQHPDEASAEDEEEIEAEDYVESEDESEPASEYGEQEQGSEYDGQESTEEYEGSESTEEPVVQSEETEQPVGSGTPDAVEETATEEKPVESGSVEENTFDPNQYNFVTAYVFNTDRVNVRKGPGTNYAKLGELVYGTEVVAASYNSEWCVVKDGDNYVYINNRYLTKTKPEEQTVAEPSVSSTPDTTSANTNTTPVTTIDTSLAGITATAQSAESDYQKQMDALCAQLESNGFTMSGLDKSTAVNLVNYYNSNYSLYNTNNSPWAIGGTNSSVTVTLEISPDATREGLVNLIVNTYGVASGTDKFQIVRDTCTRVRSKMNFSYAYTDTPMTTSIRNGLGVCEQYARIAYVLLNAEGIPTRMAAGYGPTGSCHIWNECYIDGSWCMVDFCIFANGNISPNGFVSSGYASSYRECQTMSW